jgi:hypothetical protein
LTRRLHKTGVPTKWLAEGLHRYGFFPSLRKDLETLWRRVRDPWYSPPAPGEERSKAEALEAAFNESGLNPFYKIGVAAVDVEMAGDKDDRGKQGEASYRFITSLAELLAQLATLGLGARPEPNEALPQGARGAPFGVQSRANSANLSGEMSTSSTEPRRRWRRGSTSTQGGGSPPPLIRRWLGSSGPAPLPGQVLARSVESQLSSHRRQSRI